MSGGARCGVPRARVVHAVAVSVRVRACRSVFSRLHRSNTEPGKRPSRCRGAPAPARCASHCSASPSSSPPSSSLSSFFSSSFSLLSTLRRRWRRRRYDVKNTRFFDAGPDVFTLPEAKTHVSYKTRDVLLVATDFGEGSLTTSGYARTVREWRRGTALADAPQARATHRNKLVTVELSSAVSAVSAATAGLLSPLLLRLPPVLLLVVVLPLLAQVFEGKPEDVIVHSAVQKSRGRTYEWHTRAVTFWTSEHLVREGIDDATGGPPRKLEVQDDAKASNFGSFLLVELRSAWELDGKTCVVIVVVIIVVVVAVVVVLCCAAAIARYYLHKTSRN